MKKNTHPEYYPNAIIHCSCGNVFKIGATKPEMHVEICSACHPFYTGQEKIVDAAGRVEKFKQRLAKKQEPKAKRKKDEPKS